ncbi:UTP--glucose-1-phosphate uridylyltransferase GalU [Longirhabdus pacifica]|uniref:UTP--glucose-1-phosphate uridylyltransferase GalU n=1 Tax=Longirhabdus pacifica TaxID=2305227 RepID=UPI001008C797|nr:UTP--glucose-1-phosphate uridylyltransferase GalU [Longirhabdus pacifica]
MKIKKAIIPAAGLGTRFLPATKAMPKEMLPIVDKPTIQYIVEEAVQSGIEEIIIVTGKGKRSIEDHFDHACELEQILEQRNKTDILKKVQKPSSLIDIHYIRQKEPLGLGHAVWCARKFIGNEPFAVLLGDDVVKAKTPCLQQLMQQYERTNASIIGVKQVPMEETHRYGIVEIEHSAERMHRLKRCVEKPLQNPPSNLAIMGRYIFTPDILTHLERTKPGSKNEIQLTDAIASLNEEQFIYAYEFDGTRYDVGEKLGFITTTIEIALSEHPELKQPLLDYMKSVVGVKQIGEQVHKGNKEAVNL